MKSAFLFSLFLLFSCTQNRPHDGGWVKNRIPKSSESKRERGPKSEPASKPIPSPQPTPTSGPSQPPETRDIRINPLPDNPLIAFASINQGDDFSVDFRASGQLIPPGLVYGLNDLRNATPGCWEAWTDAVTPTGGLLRLWAKYSITNFGQEHLDTARRAQVAGLDVMFTPVGNTREKLNRERGGVVRLTRIPDVEAWTKDVIRDVKRLLQAGIAVRRIEIWNEPNLGWKWPGSIESFGTWFAEAGKLLREEFGSTIALGGPGLAGTLGEKLEWVRAMFTSCKRVGFQPDFYSWHHYGSFPTEHDMLQVPQVILAECQTAGLQPMEFVLSEWNIGLPHPKFPAIDDHRAANYFIATVISLSRTQASDASFFFLQDARWDTKKEFAGESVGAFSLAGAPKALLSGMRMMATAADLPAIPVERIGAPANISLFASKQGNRGYLLAVNTFGGGLDRHISRLLRRAGVDLAALKKDGKRLQAYVYGKADRSSLSRLKLDAATMDAIDLVRLEAMADQAEEKAGMRKIRVQLKSGPKSIRSVRLIDRTHGNPIADADFKKAYAPYARGLVPAAQQATIDQLRTEGVAESTLRTLEQGMKSSKGKVSGVDAATNRRARAIFDEAMVRLASEVPKTLAAHPAAQAQEVEVASVCSLKDGILEIRLPLESSVLIELAW